MLERHVVREPVVGHTGMRHYALTADRYICGAPRDPSRPFAPSPGADCVVCIELWGALPFAEKIAIKRDHGTL